MKTNQFDSCDNKLQTLLDFTLLMNTSVSTRSLLRKFKVLLKNQLGINKMVMYSQRVRWKPIMIYGVDKSKYLDIDIKEEFIDNIDPKKDIIHLDKKYKDLNVLIPVYDKDRGNTPLSVLLIDDNNKENSKVVSENIKFIQVLANVVIVAIRSNRRYKKNLARETAYKEMEFATKVQDMLIPEVSKINQFEKLNFNGFYQPHFIVGGDYFDAFPLNDNEAIFCIADVSGKGISAALLMSSIQANLKAIFSSSVYLSDVVTLLNERIINQVHGERFITMFIAIFNSKTNELKYINAGHNPPILYNKKTEKFEYLDKGCIGIGMVDNIENIEEVSIYIDDNSKLLCYTDGLIELAVGESIHVFEKDVEKYFCTNDTSMESIDIIVKNMQINQLNNSIFDDVTMLGVDFNVEKSVVEM